MTVQQPQLKQLAYTGGVNTAASLGEFPSNQMLSCESLLISGASLVNRGGAFNLLNQSAVTTSFITSIFYWIDLAGNEWFIFGARDGSNNAQIYAMKNDGSTQSPTALTTTGVVNEFAKYDVLNGVVGIAAQVLPLGWTGSGSVASLGTSWASLNVSMIDVRVVNNFMFFAGAGAIATASNVYWSNVADATTFTAGNFAPFRAGDGDRIAGLSNIGNDLIIFKSHSTGSLSTQTNFIAGAVALGPLNTVNDSIGCIGPQGYDHLPDGRIILMASDGHAYIFDGSIFTDISNQPFPAGNIQSKFDNLANNGHLSVSTGSCSVRTYSVRHEVWFSVFSSSGTDIFIYDYLNNAWFEKISTGATHYITALARASAIRAGGFAAVTGTLSGIYQRYNAIISGDAAATTSGGLWLEDCGLTTDQSGSFPTTTLELTIPVVGDYRASTQRFFVVPFQTSTSNATITYFVGQNGTYGSSQTFTSTGGWDRLQIPLVSSPSITSQQVKIQYQASVNITIDPAYVMETVLE